MMKAKLKEKLKGKAPAAASVKSPAKPLKSKKPVGY